VLAFVLVRRLALLDRAQSRRAAARRDAASCLARRRALEDHGVHLGNFSSAVRRAVRHGGGLVAPNNYTFADSLILVPSCCSGHRQSLGAGGQTFIVVVVRRSCRPSRSIAAVCMAHGHRGAALCPDGLLPRPVRALFSGMAAMKRLAGSAWAERGVSAASSRSMGSISRSANEILGLIGPNGSGRPRSSTSSRHLWRGCGHDHLRRRRHDRPGVAAGVYRAGIAAPSSVAAVAPLSVFDNIMIRNHKRLSQASGST